MSRRNRNRRGPSQARKPDHDHELSMQPSPAPQQPVLDTALEESRRAIGLPLTDIEKRARNAALGFTRHLVHPNKP